MLNSRGNIHCKLHITVLLFLNRTIVVNRAVVCQRTTVCYLLGQNYNSGHMIHRAWISESESDSSLTLST